ncbi:hypothetical protein SAMN05444678_107196 [Sphingomonas sp. YR710]|nr:hypothetical protein SAMN05444678_107196 [Sphingomonas sp. YR710]
MDCIAIVGLLCLANPTSVILSPPSTIYRYADIVIGTAKAEIILSSDNLSEFDLRRMARACKDATCVWYHKYCERTPSEVTCSYTLNYSSYAKVLRLSASNAASFGMAEQSIGLIDRRGRDAAVVPLSLLSEVSADAQPPTCRHSGRGPQCTEGNGS